MKLDPSNQLLNRNNQQLVKTHPYQTYFRLTIKKMQTSFNKIWRLIWLRISLVIIEVIALFIIPTPMLLANLFVVTGLLFSNLITAFFVFTKLLTTIF